MKKLFSTLLITGCLCAVLSVPVSAAATTHKVAAGESLWKIAVKYQVGLSELKSANPQIKNFDLIYPGQIINLPATDSVVTSYEQEVIRLVNEIRAKNGLKPLSYHWELGRVARYKSQDMRDHRYFAHNSPVYGSPGQMVKSFGISYRTVGENIAKGYRTAQAVVEGWMNSAGHRANILNATYTHIGVGYVADGHYWTQLFMSR